MSDLVLVTGATGKQGGAVARHLIRTETSLRVLTRNPDSERARTLSAAGAEVVAGDLDDRASLASALTGVDSVFSVQDYWSAGYDGEIRQARNLIEAAGEAGVSHLVQSTMADAPDGARLPRHFASKRAVEAILADSGIPHTLLGTVVFMDNFAEPGINGRLLMPMLAGTLDAETRLHLLAVDDIGAVAAAVLTDPAPFRDVRIDLAGDLLTVAGLKRAYRRATGRRPTPGRLPAWISRRVAAEFADQLRWHNECGFTVEPGSLPDGLPRLRNFETYLRRR